MSIRFACEHCGQRLSVDESKVGRRAKCPQCKEILTVPTAEAAAAGMAALRTQRSASGAADDDDPFAEFTVYDDETELVYEDEEEEGGIGPLGGTAGIDYDKVAVSRSILYTQGVLLGVVALAAFSLGVLFGNFTAKPGGETTDAGGRLSGTIYYVNDAGVRMPDDNSVVIVVPQDVRPDEKIDIAGIRAEDDAPPPNHPSVLALRAIGGDHARTGAAGEFTLSVPATGSYFVLILSRHARRPADGEPNTQDLAQIGRYFTSAVDLLGSSKYVWRSKLIRGGSRLNHDFGRSREP